MTAIWLLLLWSGSEVMSQQSKAFYLYIVFE